MLSDIVQVKIGEFGVVELLDVLGSDADIAAYARTSVLNAKKRSEDRGLLRNLVRNRHTSPLEMGEMIFRVKLPIFLARQWIRHRTANVSEVSGRYSEMPDEIMIPGEWRLQGLTNRQMSGDTLPENIQRQALGVAVSAATHARQSYEELLALGVSRELARVVLPLDQATLWVWKIDIHNLMHFLKLRLAHDAQPEIRVYAQALEQFMKERFPILHEAFVDYRRDAIDISRMGREVIGELLTPEQKAMLEQAGIDKGMSKAEAADFAKSLT